MTNHTDNPVCQITRRLDALQGIFTDGFVHQEVRYALVGPGGVGRGCEGAGEDGGNGDKGGVSGRDDCVEPIRMGGGGSAD